MVRRLHGLRFDACAFRRLTVPPLTVSPLLLAPQETGEMNLVAQPHGHNLFDHPGS